MIHPTALVDPDAQLAEDVEVGPYTIIGAGVTLLQDAQAKEVYMSRNAQKLPLSSDQI